MKNLSLTLLICSFLFLASCADSGLTKGQQGAVGGAGAGALIGQMIGHNTEATLIGAAVGTMIGYIVGNEMDKYDRQQLNHVYERGVSGNTTAWVNPDNGNRYSVTPQPAYTSPRTDQPCRKAEIIALIDGKEERTYTTACRDQNGHWQLQ
ncbi:MAG: glycine zipper domain-containing protein [Desulfobulbaceae bacterium]|nr:glycine zipper domain-containing protein [Desulfobulbaceae bacterium]